MSAYDSKEIEPEVLEFWKENAIYDKCVAKNRGKRRFYFIDGPPYTTGSIHIGHAWNKSLKDCILRYKRMRGFDVWSQPGFDMHGLPIEVAVEKKLGIKDKKEIVERFGVRKFVDECERFSVEQMHPMIKDFARLGVWMEWDKPYMAIDNEYIEGAWWALAEADRNGYLYEGKKSMTWCPRCATALAKHELSYMDVVDRSVFVKFPVKSQDNTFLVIWTTTPWTLPFNLAVMAHPEFDYVKAEVDGEFWILAKVLAKKVISDVCGRKFAVVEEFKGSKLENLSYVTPFFDEIPFQKSVSNAHVVVLSSEFVDLESGSGLVHTAPGCGPEDFEIGKRHGLPAFNTLDETGKFSEAGIYDGLFARKDDPVFVEALKGKGLLLSIFDFKHEYAHCWRCYTPVIFRSTEQWFLAVESIRDEMLNQNEKVNWVPDWAGSRWFESWLENIQDWCISRQRFWGIPLPIWKCSKCASKRVVGSMDELPVKMENLHKPWIDEVKLQCKCGSEMSRIPDVLDVWLDSGAASWAPLGFPGRRDIFDDMWPADFILEGKDQIRGWFNSMMCLSMVSHRRNSYKAVYMHGFVNDAMGRKMSKSLKNTISPYEVIDNYGADTLRFYSIGGAKPGFDLNYNFEDMKIKHKNLTVFWNVCSYLLELSESAQFDGEKELSVEERYMLSKTHTAIGKVTYMFDNYYINEVPWLVEDLLLELSRTYIQLTREKSVGSDVERNTVLHTVYSVFVEALKLLAPVAPFIAEKMYQRIRGKFELGVESIHLHDWPSMDNEMVDESVEKEFDVARGAMQAILAVRERIKLGVRWPLKEAVVVAQGINSDEVLDSVRRQTNLKSVRVASSFEGVKVSVKADYDKLRPRFGNKTPKVIAAIAMASPETILKYIERDGQFMLSLDEEKVMLTQSDFIISKQAPHGFEYEPFEFGDVYVSIISSRELEAEGYAREIVRRIQNLRKSAGLRKPQRILLHVSCPDVMCSVLKAHQDVIKARVGADSVEISPEAGKYEFRGKERVRDIEFSIFFDVA